MKYIPFIVIDGKEFEVITEDIACAKEEAIEFCSGMVKCDKIDYVITKQGILSYKSEEVQSVYYICKPYIKEEVSD